jgi:hypothetical protein
MRSTDKERKEITRSLVEACYDVVINEAKGLVGDNLVDPDVEFIEQNNGNWITYKPVSDKAKQILRQSKYTVEKGKLHNVTSRLSVKHGLNCDTTKVDQRDWG